MKPYYEHPLSRVFHGDCREVLQTFEPDSIDAIVTDPPYELNFMGRSWDNSGVAFERATWEACYRVLKPGGHLLAFGGSRTFHRIAVAIEDAGFEIRDTISWLYGSGFPKSLDVSKAIDKSLNAQGEYGDPKTTAHAGWIERGRMRADEGHEGYQRPWMQDPEAVDKNARQYLPATPEAQQWDGWGTALKPAWEPVIVARKPFKGTVAANVLKHGTGALNIDAIRIGSRAKDPQYRPVSSSGIGNGKNTYGTRDGIAMSYTEGRWPANVILDEDAAAMLDAQTGILTSGSRTGKRTQPKTKNAFGAFELRDESPSEASSGGASRFFYCAKASRAERNAGLDGMPEGSRPLGISNWKGQTNGSGDTMGPSAPQSNDHPTVKPLSLMRYLITLVTPPNGIVVDPFLGSGSTLVAAAQLGVQAIGIEQEQAYCDIAVARIAHKLSRIRNLELDLEEVS